MATTKITAAQQNVIDGLKEGKRLTVQYTAYVDGSYFYHLGGFDGERRGINVKTILAMVEKGLIVEKERYESDMSSATAVIVYQLPEQVVEETQEPEQVEVTKEPIADTKTETRYRVLVKTFEGEIKSYPASTKKEADEIFSRESHPLNAPMENYQVQLQDSGRERTTWKWIVQCDLTRCGCNSRTREEYEAWKQAQVKPELTDSTITYTIVERDEPGKSPFYARVFVPGEEVQDFDPIRHDEWWQHTKSDLVFAVNKAFKGAWYLSPEQLEARVAEMTEASTEEPTSELTDTQRNAILAQKRAESAEYLAQMDSEIQAYIAEEIARMPIQRQEELQHMTFDQEVRILKNFHDQHSTETGVCAWCHHRVPSQQLTPFPVTIDQNTGMPSREEFVCDECLEPVRRQQAETDAGYEPHNPESPNYDCFEEDL